MLKLNERGSILPQLLNILINHPKSRMPHIKHLLKTIEDEERAKSADSSSLLCGYHCSPIMKKPDLDAEVLTKLLDLGAYLTVRDLQRSIKILQESQVTVGLLGIIINHCKKCQHVDHEKLCQKSLKAKKPQFVAYFISCGATPSVLQVMEVMNQKYFNKDLRSYIILNASKSERADLVSEALQKWDLEFATELMEYGPLDSEKINLGKLLESTFLPTRPDLVEQLLGKGIDPDGTPGSSRSPLDVVLSLDKKRYSEKGKASLITVLVNRGAHDVKGTTVIHIATEFALATGSYIYSA